MAKPPKVPRPVKPPVLPPRPEQEFSPTIGLNQEKLIGRTVVAWSKLEACMQDFIWYFLDLEMDRGRVITDRSDVTARIRWLRQLGQLRLPEADFHILSPILDRIDILREDRNFIVHGTWGTSDTEPVCLSVRVTAPNPNEIVSETFSAIRMRAIIDGIERAKWDLIGLMTKLGALPETPTAPPPEGQDRPPQDHP